MKKVGFRALSILLCLCMALGMLPPVAWAAADPGYAAQADTAAPSYLAFGSTWVSQAGQYPLYLFKVEDSNLGSLTANTQATLVNQVVSGGTYMIVTGANTSDNSPRSMFYGSAVTNQLKCLNPATLSVGTAKTFTELCGTGNNQYQNWLFTLTESGDGMYTIKPYNVNKYLTLDAGASSQRAFSDTETKLYITPSAANRNAFYITTGAPGEDTQEFFGFGSNGWTANTVPYVMYLYSTTEGGSSGSRTTSVTSGNHYMLLGSTGGTQTNLPILYVGGANTDQHRAGSTAGESLTSSGGKNTTFTITYADDAKPGSDGPYIIKSDAGDYWLTLTASGSQLAMATSEDAATRFYITASTETEGAVYISSVKPYHDPPREERNFLAFQNEGGDNRGWVSRETPQALFFYKYSGVLEDAAETSELARADTLDVTGNVYYMIVTTTGTALACKLENGKYVTFCYDIFQNGNNAGKSPGDPVIKLGVDEDDDARSALFTIDAVDQLGTTMEHHIASALYPDQHLSLEKPVELGTRRALEFTTEEGHPPSYITPVSLTDEEDAARHTYYISLSEYYEATFDEAPTKDFSSVKYLTFGQNSTDRWAAGDAPFKMYLYELPYGESWTTDQVAIRTTEVKPGYHYLIVSSQSSVADNGVPRYMHAYNYNGAYRVNQCQAPSDIPATITLNAAHNGGGTYTAEHVFYITPTTKTAETDTTMYLIESHNCPDYYLTMDSTTTTPYGLMLNNNPMTHVKFYITPSERYADEEAVYITVGGPGVDPEPTISEMFDSSMDNTWVFTGGADVAGGFEQTEGMRNYVGHFEESVRWNQAGGSIPGRQRYVINTGKDGQTLAQIVQDFDTRVSNYNPKAVAYLVSADDAAEQNFAANLQAFVGKCFDLRDGYGMIVIQTLSGEVTDKVKDALKDEPYASKLDSRIVIVEHTGVSSPLTEEGHQTIADQLLDATIGTNHSFGTAWNFATVTAPSTYSETAPEVSVGTNSLDVTISISGEWNYRLILSNGEVVTGSATGNEKCTIEGLPSDVSYELIVRSSDGATQLATQSGTIGNPTTETNPYAAAVAAVANLVKEQRQLTWLFMGDSITHGAAHTHYYDSISQTFEKYLHDPDGMNRPQDVVVNTAVSGASTTDDAGHGTLPYLQYRLQNYVGAKPDVVSIMLGTNDNAYSVSEADYEANLRKIINAIHSVDFNPNAIIVLRSPTYCTERPNAGTTYGPVMEELVKTDPAHIIYIDQDTEMRNAATTYTWMASNQSYSTYGFYGDNIHPGPLGQLIMARQFIRGLGLWDWDNAIANLDYVVNIPNTDDNNVDLKSRIAVDSAAGSFTLNITDLNTAYTSGTLGHTTLTAVNKESNVSYEITVPNGSTEAVLSGLPKGEYDVTVKSILTGATAKSVTFVPVSVKLLSSETGIESITVGSTTTTTKPYGSEPWTLELPDPSTLPAATEDDIKVELTDTNATYKVKAGEGEGVYIITVTAEDGTTTKEYTLRVTIKNHEHNWGDESNVTFHWRGDDEIKAWLAGKQVDDGATFTSPEVDAISGATRTCMEEKTGENPAKQTATMSVAVTAWTAPTCTKPGTITLTPTATFTDEPVSVPGEPKTVELPATGHDWTGVAPTWTWKEDTENGGWKATATKTCTTGSEETWDVEATVTSETIREAVCATGGEIKYTATAIFTYEDETEAETYTDTKIVNTPALGHDWGEDEDITWTWTPSGSGYTASARRVCENDSSHVQTATVTVNVQTDEATCTEGGKTVYTATATFTDDTGSYTDTKEVPIPATGHGTMTHTERKEPTCTAPGNVAYYQCPICHNYYADADGNTPIEGNDPALAALGHELTLVPAKASTRTEPGNKQYYECDRCEKYFEDHEGNTEITDKESVIIPVTNHDHVWGTIEFEWIDDGLNTAATLTGSGCTGDPDCDQEESVIAEVTIDSKTDPTCTEVGEVTFIATATFAGESEPRTSEEHKVTLPATGHDMEHVEATDATCTAPGNEEHWKCAVCEKLFDAETGGDEIDEEDVIIDPIPHATEKVDAVAATCTTTGLKEHWKCTACGKLFEDELGNTPTDENEVTIPAAGHHLEKVEAKEATTSATGLKEHWKCTVCEKLFEDEEGAKETTLEAVTIPKKEASPGPGPGTNPGTTPGATPGATPGTNPGANSTVTQTSPEGVVGSTTTDTNGNVTDVGVVVPKAAADSGDVLTAPVEVKAASSSASAPEIDITVQGGGSAKVEIPVTDAGPGVVAVVVDENGKETILRDCIVTEDGVALTVDGSATVKIVDNSKRFVDIDTVPWAEDAIIFTAARELFQGTGDAIFEPNLTTNRGMVVTLLYRLEYEPDFGYSNFGDVASGSWYAQAVAWGQSTGVVAGYSSDNFGPQDSVTREQLAVMLYRYATLQDMDTTARGNLSAFTDGGATSDWAARAMEWAVGTGLVLGDGSGSLSAGDYATRAQIAVILQRFCQLRYT